MLLGLGRAGIPRGAVKRVLTVVFVLWAVGLFVLLARNDTTVQSLSPRPDAIVRSAFESSPSLSLRPLRLKDPRQRFDGALGVENQKEDIDAPIDAHQAAAQEIADPTPTHRIDSSIDNAHFEELLARIADPVTNSVIITFTNSGFIELAYNWLHYVKSLNLTNYLIVCFDELACTKLEQYGERNCYYNYSAGPLPTDSQGYGSPNYIKLVNWKPKYTLALIKRGYNILVTDVDTIWSRNPYHHLLRTCDLEIEVDTIVYHTIPKNYTLQCSARSKIVYLSTGVYYMTSNLKTVTFIQSLIAYQSNPHSKFFDQPAFNHVLSMQNMSIRALSPLYFPSGHHYFIQKLPQRHHARPYIIHNNVLVNGDEAKRHRFREYHLWAVDEDDYFKGQFIVAETQVNTCAGILDDLKNGLAIARLLNRTLILPTFDCRAMCRCSTRCIGRVGSFMKPPCIMSDFFQMDVLGKNFDYREHSFLSHPRGLNYTSPENHLRIKLRLSGESHLFDSLATQSLMERVPDGIGWRRFNISEWPAIELHTNATQGLSETELKKTLKPYEHVPLLILHTFVGRFRGFDDPRVATDFMERAQNSLHFLACNNPHCAKHQV